MNIRDFEKKPTHQITYKNSPDDRKPKTSIWDKLSDLSLDSFSDRIKFLIIFTLVGLGTILIGDLIKLIPLRGTGIAFQIMGWIVIGVSFLIPLFKFLDEHN